MADSSLVVVTFEEEQTAERVLKELLDKEDEHLIDLKDAVLITKNKEGKVKIKQTKELTAESGLFQGIFWGWLAGLLFLFNPYITAAAGALIGAILGELEDTGIDDKFIKRVAKIFKPGMSAIMVLVRQDYLDKIVGEFKAAKGEIMQTTIPERPEEKLLSQIMDAMKKAEASS